jgi:hypothetical protein
MTLHQIYNSLHAAGLVTSQRQFSREWLQKQPSYMSCCESRYREPSFEVLLVLHNRIRRLIALSAAGPEEVCQQRERLEQLSAGIRNTIGRRLQSGGSAGC